VPICPPRGPLIMSASSGRISFPKGTFCFGAVAWSVELGINMFFIRGSSLPGRSKASGERYHDSVGSGKARPASRQALSRQWVPSPALDRRTRRPYLGSAGTASFLIPGPRNTASGPVERLLFRRCPVSGLRARITAVPYNNVATRIHSPT